MTKLASLFSIFDCADLWTGMACDRALQLVETGVGGMCREVGGCCRSEEGIFLNSLTCFSAS
ncbi:hypothetical protein E2C01_102719 [Portunus trituberculatus]|uniref:Uncharacterized protein n=1 Tax=Portunus trituberculatus TaxID=210409 RepID=A0A5B7KJ77_PORTR|nr:hypothetical protein [Portunus trituberculatus]